MKRPLLVAGALFVLGEAAVREMTENCYYSIGLIISGILIAYISNKGMLERSKSNTLLLFLCFIFGAVWGFGYYYTGENDAEKIFESSIQNEEKVGLKLYVSEINDTASGKQLLLCKKNGIMKRKTYLLMYLREEDVAGLDKKAEKNNQPILEVGRSIYVEGTLSPIEGATNPGQFDMKYYYLGKGVNFQIKRKGELKVTDDGINYIALYLGRIRMRAAEIIDRYYSSEDAGVIKTMLLGDRSDMPDETTVLFRRNGVAHILAISGLHIALLAGVIEYLLSKLYVKRNKSAAIVIVFMILYGIMTGFSPATLRAVLMLSMTKIAYIVKRTTDLPTSMMEALLVMIFINPDCIFSTGMLMSYAAVLGVWTETLFYNSVYMREHFNRFPEKIRPLVKKLLGSIIISISIGLWMTPLLMLTMYEVPVFSLVLNLFITGLLTVLLCCAFIVTVVGSIGTVLVGTEKLMILNPFVDISSGIIRFYRWMCWMMLRCPFSVVISGHIEVWQAVIIYGGIILFVSGCYRYMQKRPVKRRDMKRRIRLTAGYILCCILISLAVTGVGKLYNLSGRRVVFLDVGQGDGSIIRSSAGRNYIIDCGSSSRTSVGIYTLIPALKYYGMDHIDAIFISHTDSDHVNGIIELLGVKELYGISVGKVIIAEGTEEDENLRLIESFLQDDNLSVGEDDSESVENSSNTISNVFKTRKGYIIDGCFEVIYPDKEGDTETTVDVKDDESIDESIDRSIDDSIDKSIDESCGHSRISNSYGYSDSNENSLVVLFHDKDVEVLYTGDISSEIEEKMLDDLKIREKSYLRILKCAHHGSKYSSSKDFLESYNPDMTVISVGLNNYGHPTKEALSRISQSGATIYRTDKTGAVIINY